MYILINHTILIATTVHQIIATWIEHKKCSTGELLDISAYKLHLFTIGDSHVTVLLDYGLAGMEGYLLIPDIAKIALLRISDCTEYDWSHFSPLR
ncbi:MAG: hypothetical protein ACFB2X_00395 [Rivularia sp. (in: cyanobacteria)]